MTNHQISNSQKIVWKFIEFQYYNPFERLGYNQLLRNKAANGEHFISLTGWDTLCVSIGAQQKINDIVNIQTANKKNILILRRESGGGATVLTKDDICWGIVAPSNEFPKDVNKIYEFACAKIISALSEMGISAKFKPINDIITQKGKISGSALKQEQNVVHVMGTLLYKKDKQLMNELLRPERDHKPSLPEKEKLVTSISEESDVTFEQAISVVKGALTSGLQIEKYEWTTQDIAFAKEYAKKFSTKEYIYER